MSSEKINYKNMNYNLYAMNGYALNYPHFTKWATDNIVHIVAPPDSLMKVDDIVFVAQETKDLEGNVSYGYFNHWVPSKITEILEERKAAGLHKTEFEPIYQKVKVERVYSPTPKS